jgi:hypothetical protein
MAMFCGTLVSKKLESVKHLFYAKGCRVEKPLRTCFKSEGVQSNDHPKKKSKDHSWAEHLRKSLVLLGNLESLKLSKSRSIPRCFHLDQPQAPAPEDILRDARLGGSEPSEISFLSGYSEIATFKMRAF